MRSSRAASIAGWIVTGFCVLFLAFDAVIHIANIPPVVDAAQKLGFPDSLMPAIGVVELVGIGLFAIPRTSVLGAIYLTAYLGGATAIQVRVAGTAWFSILIGLLVWIGLYLRNAAIRDIVPLCNRTVA